MKEGTEWRKGREEKKRWKREEEVCVSGGGRCDA